MGHQINFFVMPAELPYLEAAIQVVGHVCFLEGKSPPREPGGLETIAAGPATGTLRTSA